MQDHPQGQASPAPHKGSRVKAKGSRGLPLPALRAFPYCVGPTELFDALWELDIVDKVREYTLGLHLKGWRCHYS
jgi:hypothetical protein